MQTPKLYSTPIAGYPIIAPEHQPVPGQVIIGYEVVDAEGTFVKPDPSRMNTVGWVSFVALLFCFWPAACIPCVTKCSYTPSQRPIYGWPYIQTRDVTISTT